LQPFADLSDDRAAENLVDINAVSHGDCSCEDPRQPTLVLLSEQMAKPPPLAIRDIAPCKMAGGGLALITQPADKSSHKLSPFQAVPVARLGNRWLAERSALKA
jgi:hypothetical protein